MKDQGAALPALPAHPPTLPSTRRERKVAVVVGAGPVGCLAALSLAKAGWTVNLYDGRPDFRLESSKVNVAQRSINLAVSSRGIAALHAVDASISSRFLTTAIPMRGRMIHDDQRNQESQIYDAQGGQCINSVERGILNEELLDQAASNPNVHIFFKHKLTVVDFDRRFATFDVTEADGRRTQLQTPFDFCVGADGSYSNVRRQMMRVVRMDYQQEYIAHEYIELRMPPGPISNGQPTFLIDPNHLHIWPRHSFMLIALPNQDRSFTCTLFAPTPDLAALDRPETILPFFKQYFPDALALIGEDLLLSDFARNPKSPLISIKARPYHYKDRGIIIGDAAHSMVPFYGQGLNCGLEDVRILQTILSKHGVDGYASKVRFEAPDDVDTRLQSALQEYSSSRYTDLIAINDMAMNNYTEMRHDVTTPIYRLTKLIDTLLASWTPAVTLPTLIPSLVRVPYPTGTVRGWLPLYTMVTFRPDIAYDVARRRAARQAHILRWTGWTAVGVFSGFAVWSIRRAALSGY